MNRRSQRLAAIITVALLLAATVWLLTRSNRPTVRPRSVQPAALPPPFDPARYTTGPFHSCAPEGDGGDPALNLLKNRDMPPPSYETMSVQQILSNQPELALAEGRAARSDWSDDALNQVHDAERRGVAVDGYMLRVKHEGPEGCNCHSDEDRDFHLWLGGSPDDDRGNAIVVEISPREIPQHPGWHLSSLQKIARERARVRISGWLMWDQEHPDQVGKTRGTLWEIHPIHRIEVYSGGSWDDL